jgi:type IV pilus assembly protein PilB
MPISAADQRLLGFLVKIGKLDRAAAEAIKNDCQKQRVSVVERLTSDGQFSEDELAESVAAGLGFPLLPLSTTNIDEWVVDFVDEKTAARLSLLAVAADDETVTLAMANPFDQEAIKSVEFASGRRVRRTVAKRSEILQAIEGAYRHESALASVLAGVPDSTLELIPGGASSSHAHELDADKLAHEAEQAPIVKMVNLILADAMAVEASDIHIEPGPNVIIVRYRIDGMLVDGHKLPKWVQNPITARIKIMAKADITERRTPQDGHFTMRHEGRVVDVRVSVLPTTDGEKFVLRLLDPNGTARKLDQLGASFADLEKIRSLLSKSEGMVLVTGPTGSGKSSTLYAMIQEIYSPRRNIVTIENPVEYNVKGVSQVDINERQGLTFATVLRSVLRQDPDVIMVGEIRDRETAEIAFRAAQTGHLVLSTLHTNDTTSTITRLLDIGIEPYLIAPSLVAVIAQRLVRKVCLQCAEPVAPAGSGSNPSVRELRQGKGCPACHGIGFAGRTGVYEILEVSKAVQQLIEAKAPESQIRTLAEEEGMISLRENAIAKVESGVTTLDEVKRVIQFDARAPKCPQCGNPVEDQFMSCPFCRHTLRSACTACGMTLKKKWTSCPHCGAAAPGEPAGAAETSPSTAAPAAVTDEKQREIETVGGAREKPRILVVDDYADVRTLVRIALETGGDAIVEEAGSGAEALALVEKHPPHLVILDLMMPGMDGYEVCRQLRSNLKTAFIPILMLTALSDSKSKSLGFLAGTDDYLVKPIENAELRSRVRWLLQRSYRIGIAAASGAVVGDPATVAHKEEVRP